MMSKYVRKKIVAEKGVRLPRGKFPMEGHPNFKSTATEED
jgi:hypothetical protein